MPTEKTNYLEIILTIENDDAVSRPLEESTTAEEVAGTNSVAEGTERTEATVALNADVVPLQSDSAGTENDDAVSRPVDESTKAEETDETSSFAELTQSSEAGDASNAEVLPLQGDSVGNNEHTGDDADASPPAPPITQGEGGVDSV
jgi:hypothetical protein